MRTDDLIRGLVADLPHPVSSFGRQLLIAVPLGLAVSMAGFFVILGLRPDLGSAAATLRFDVKLLQVTLLFVTAAVLTARLARPGLPTGLAGVAIWTIPALALLAVAVELVVTPPAQWAGRLVGSNARVCLVAIPSLTVPILAGAFYALRQAAPTRPVRLGAAAGALASGLAATLYALHCTDDSPLFVVTWYGLTITAMTFLGALGGRLLLRW